MGLASKSHWSKYLGATAPFDTLLGVKYVIVDGDYAIPDTYVHIYDGKETGVYENPDALSIAYAVNGALRLPTSVPPLYTCIVTVPVPQVLSGSCCASASGTVH